MTIPIVGITFCRKCIIRLLCTELTGIFFIESSHALIKQRIKIRSTILQLRKLLRSRNTTTRS